MKTQRTNNLKRILLMFVFLGFALPSFAKPHHYAPGFGYHKKHHYVYYPKQNFYYDPYLGHYIVVENDNWVRRLTPPRMFAKINVNVLPHADIYVESFYPYELNIEHRQRYFLVAAIAPNSSFYAFRMPLRFDFAITPYTYYRPGIQIVMVDYNPNYYYHPGKGHGRGNAYGHYKHHNHPYLAPSTRYYGHNGHTANGKDAHHNKPQNARPSGPFGKTREISHPAQRENEKVYSNEKHNNSGKGHNEAPAQPKQNQPKAQPHNGGNFQNSPVKDANPNKGNNGGGGNKSKGGGGKKK